MKVRRFLSPTQKIGLGLCAALLGMLTGCVTHVEAPHARYHQEPAVTVVQDDYIYYPHYECYYSVSRHQYAYPNGRNWVYGPAPRGVSVSVIQASPAVRMNFHDSPAQHHATVVTQYPKNWKPSGGHQVQNWRHDQDDEHGDNH